MSSHGPKRKVHQLQGERSAKSRRMGIKGGREGDIPAVDEVSVYADLDIPAVEVTVPVYSTFQDSPAVDEVTVPVDSTFQDILAVEVTMSVDLTFQDIPAVDEVTVPMDSTFQDNVEIAQNFDQPSTSENCSSMCFSFSIDADNETIKSAMCSDCQSVNCLSVDAIRF